MTVSFFSFLGLATFLIALIGTRLTILSFRKRLMLQDFPSLRGKHRLPTPRAGGLALMTALLIGLSVADIQYGLILSLLLLMAVSLLDDLIILPSPPMLAVEIMAVTIMLSTFIQPIFGGILPLGEDRLVAALLWIGFTHHFSSMDGIDGISGVEAITIGGGLCWVLAINNDFSGSLFPFSLVGAAAAGGFLWWNWHPAKISLGRAGSIPLGFFLGYLLLASIESHYIYAALLLPAYYICDGSATLLGRLLAGEKIWKTPSHYYFRQAISQGMKPDKVTRYIVGANILLAFLATRATLDPQLAWLYTGLGYACVGVLLAIFAHKRKPAAP